MPDPKSENPAANSRLSACAAAVWVVLFLVACFSLQFTNDPPVTRWQLWSLVPELLDFIDPPAEVAGQAGARSAGHSGWQYFPQRFDLLAVAAIMLAGAWGTGSLVLRVLRPPLPAASLEHTIFAFGVGLSALSLATLGAGLAGALSRPLLGSLIALAFIAELALRFFLPPFARGGRGGRAAAGSTLSPLKPGHWLLLATLAPFLLATLLGALLPSTDFDVNEYHFQGPKEFFQAGKISFLEHNVYTSFPFGTEMLTLLAMVLEGDWYRGALAGKAVLMCFGPLAGLALFAAGRRWFGTTAGVLAAVLYLSTPWIYRISTIAYAEGGVCFYLFASLFALMIAADHLTEAVSVRQFLLAGLLAGSAMACKYPALVSIVVPGFAVTVWLAARQQGKARWVLPGAFLAGTLVAVGPWLIKNTVETGNPVYPLAYGVFGGRDWDAVLDARWKKGHSPGTYSLSSLAKLAIEVAARSTWNSPLLFALAPLALLAVSWRRRAAWLWLYVGWLFFSCWLFTHRIDRFWVPLLPVVALLAGGGAAWCWQALEAALTGFAPGGPAAGSAASWLSRRDRLLGLSVVLVPFVAIGLFNLEIIVNGLSGYNDYLRDLDEAGQIAAEVTSPEIVWLNHSLPPASRKVLAVGEAEMFYARFSAAYNTVFDKSIMEEWCAARPGEPSGAAGLRDAEAIHQKLAAEGITHVYVNWLEVLRYRSPGNYGYTDFVTPALFAELVHLGILRPAFPIPHAAMPLDRLDASWREEALAWGKALVTNSADGPVFTTFQVFPVVPRGGR